MYGKYFVLATVLLGVIYSKDADKIKVSIFYESYCPCSTAFITKNFYPAFKDMKQYIDVEFVPYGNTESKLEDGKLVYHCKGDKNGTSCYANRVHACAVSSKSPENATVEFVNCIITTQYSRADVEFCSQSSGMDIKYINGCVEKNTSDTLLSEFGNKTKSQHLTHIPGVVFNDVYNKTVDENARKNFRKVICELLDLSASQLCQDLERYNIN